MIEMYIAMIMRYDEYKDEYNGMQYYAMQGTSMRCYELVKNDDNDLMCINIYLFVRHECFFYMNVNMNVPFLNVFTTHSKFNYSFAEINRTWLRAKTMDKGKRIDSACNQHIYVY